MSSEYRVLINGELCEASTKETMEVINPANGKVVGLAPKCSSLEIDRAAEAAYKAAPAWAEKSPTDKAALFFKMAELLRARRDEWAKLETMQYGGPIFKTYNFDMTFDAQHFEFMAGVARAMNGANSARRSSGHFHDYPPASGRRRFDYAVEFPSCYSDLKNYSGADDGEYRRGETSFLRSAYGSETRRAFYRSRLPARSIEYCDGSRIFGRRGAWSSIPYVVKINFTGDSETGKRILALASAAVKPVACELGGKNAFIVLPDADMKAAVEGAVWGGFFNSGQNCGASSRYLIHQSVYDEFVEKFVAATKLLRVGDPLNPETMIGPVAYKGHRDNIERFVERAKKSGAKLLLGGERPNTPETKDGCFVAPDNFWRL